MIPDLCHVTNQGLSNGPLPPPLLVHVAIEWPFMQGPSVCVANFQDYKITLFFGCLQLAKYFPNEILWRDHCAPWLLKKKVTIIIQQQAAGYKHCILCVTVWYGKPKLFSTIVHTNWFNDFARPPAHLKLHSGWFGFIKCD